MQERKPKVEYKVFYEAKPDYDGDYNRDLLPGLHGTFTFEKDAQEAARKCRAWYNEEKSVRTEVGKDGKGENVPNVEVHDNVVVTIKKYVDNQEVKEQVCLEKEKKPKRELATA